jgi:hypothetical protein
VARHIVYGGAVADLITWPDSTLIRTPSAAVTLGCWVNITGSGQGNTVVLGKRHGTTFHTWSIASFFSAPLDQLAYISVSGTLYSTANATLTANTWYFVVAKWASGGRLFFQAYTADGVKAFETDNGSNISGTIDYDTGVLMCGQSDDLSSNQGDFYVANGFASSVALADNEIFGFAKASGVVPRGVVFMAPFTGISDPEPDFAGGAQGTVTSAPPNAEGPPVLMAPMAGDWQPEMTMVKSGWPTYAAFKSNVDDNKMFEEFFYKTGPTNEGAGFWTSLWYAAGKPAAGADPAATPGTAYSSAAGSLFFPATYPYGRFLVQIGAIATQNCVLMLYDRLVGVSGLSVASTGDKTVNSIALPRYSGPPDVYNVEAWLEITTVTATTAPIVTMNSYTNGAGTAGQGGVATGFPAAVTDVRTMVRLKLDTASRGVKACATINVGTAASAGVVNFLLIRPLAYMNLRANMWTEKDLLVQMSSFVGLQSGHSLALAMLATGTTAANIEGTIKAAY